MRRNGKRRRTFIFSSTATAIAQVREYNDVNLVHEVFMS
jgi:hypothetical protein